jgi:hypothetical protein
MTKKAWISSLCPDGDAAAPLIKTLKTYGISGSGHVWEDNLEQMAWMGPRDELLDPATALWVIHAQNDKLQQESLRYGLSVLALTVMATRGTSLPILIVTEDDTPLPSAELPTPLMGVDCLSARQASLGPKIVAMIHRKPASATSDYHLDVYGTPQIGQWFEVGPQQETWNGALFGVDRGEIAFHAAGPRGRLPEKATMEYAVKGARLQLGDKDYTAWACQNAISLEESYFVKVDGHPGSILFGPYSDEDQAEVYRIALI